jgi:hypothetical protein
MGPGREVRRCPALPGAASARTQTPPRAPNRSLTGRRLIRPTHLRRSRGDGRRGRTPLLLRLRAAVAGPRRACH